MSEVIFEFIQMGQYVKVVAVEAQTGLEVSIVGDRHSSQEVLKKTALRKLDYVKNRSKN